MSDGSYRWHIPTTVIFAIVENFYIKKGEYTLLSHQNAMFLRLKISYEGTVSLFVFNTVRK